MKNKIDDKAQETEDTLANIEDDCDDIQNFIDSQN